MITLYRPTGYFTTAFMVTPYAYDFRAANNNRIKMVSSVQFSHLYTGNWTMVLSVTDDDFTNLPEFVHVIWTMIGF